MSRTATTTQTEDSVFPITRTWTRSGRGLITSGEYTIRSNSDFSNFGSSFTILFQGKKIDAHTRQATAKVAVEKHAAGFSTFVAFYNVEGWDK